MPDGFTSEKAFSAFFRVTPNGASILQNRLGAIIARVGVLKVLDTSLFSNVLRTLADLFGDISSDHDFAICRDEVLCFSSCFQGA